MPQWNTNTEDQSRASFPDKMKAVLNAQFAANDNAVTPEVEAMWAASIIAAQQLWDAIALIDPDGLWRVSIGGSAQDGSTSISVGVSRT